MDRKLLAVVAVLAGGPAMTDAPSSSEQPVRGTTTCDQSAGGGSCRIAWEFPETSHAFYFIEAMDPESSTWHRVAGPLSARSGVTEETMLEGRLYRTVACEDPLGTRSCVGSTAVWALFHPMSADAIPRSVDDKRGVPMMVSKSTTDLKSQMHVYNVYLVRRLLNGVADVRSMPPMSAPRFGLEVPIERVLTEATHDEIVGHDVYRHYEVWRIEDPDQ